MSICRALSYVTIHIAGPSYDTAGNIATKRPAITAYQPCIDASVPSAKIFSHVYRPKPECTRPCYKPIIEAAGLWFRCA